MMSLADLKAELPSNDSDSAATTNISLVDDVRLDVKVDIWSDEKLLQIKNHTAIMYNNRIYIFGGYTGFKNLNRMCILDPKTNTCTSIKPTSDAYTPDGRNGHASVVIGNKMYVIGGWVGKGFFASSKLFVLDLDSLKWEALQTSGSEPGPCNMHTADYYKRKIYIFRGGDGKSYLSDLHSLDIQTCQWERVEGCGSQPPPRANHASTIVKQFLYIFGGWDGFNRLNDLHRINLETLQWEKVSPKDWSSVPPPRAGMKMINVNDAIYMFGGSGSVAMLNCDLWVYYPQRNDWFQCRVQDPESLLSQPTSVPAQQLNFNSPDRRESNNSSSMNLVQSQQQQQVMTTSTVTANEGQKFILEEIVKHNPLSPRSGHSMTLLKNRLFIVGGSLGRDYYKNYIVVDIDPQPEMAVESGLESAYNNREFADICFDIDGEMIYAHRVILNMLGETFNALLKMGMEESMSKVVRLNIIEPAIFKIILRSLYRNRLDLTPAESVNLELLFELYQCCDQLLILKLKQVVLARIKEIVTRENAAKISEMASIFQAEFLVQYCKWVLRRVDYA